MKFGGTPLHWSSSREVIDSLISNNCDMNALNFDKRTALHIMVIFLYDMYIVLFYTICCINNLYRLCYTIFVLGFEK